MGVVGVWEWSVNSERWQNAQLAGSVTVSSVYFFFFFGICIYNAQHVCNYKDAREVAVHFG